MTDTFRVRLSEGADERIKADFAWIGNDGALTLRVLSTRGYRTADDWSEKYGKIIAGYAPGTWKQVYKTDDEGEE